MRKSVAAIRHLFRFSRAEDTHGLLAAVSRQGLPDSVALVFLGPDRRPVDLRVVTDGGNDLAKVVELTCRLATPEASSVFVITDRTGEVPADRPDDELVWMELVELTEQAGIALLDWFVVCGMESFSVAEFAPIPARW